MKIVLAAAGSAGDVGPFSVLATALSRRGNDVELITHQALAHLAGPGVRVRPVRSDPSALMAGPAARALARLDLGALNDNRHLFADFVDAFSVPAEQALRGADVLIASTFALAPVHAALQAGVPVIRVHLWPESPGLAGPMPLLPYGWRLPSPVRILLRAGLRRLEPYLGGVEGAWRAGRLTLHARHPVRLTTATLATVHAYSPALPARPPRDAFVTGWWVDDTPATVSAATAAALDGTDEWAYLGFGSMPQRDPGEVIEVFEQACARVGLRPVVQVPDPAAARPAPGTVMIGHEPHADLFARMRAVVHHGGSGTVGSVVRAGVPSVVVPHLADQFYWAHRLRARGVAPAPLPRTGLSVRRLTARLGTATAAPMTRRAQHLAATVRAEDGVATAAALVERLLGGAPAHPRT